MNEEMPNIEEWVGKSREQRERIETAITAGMSAALDRDDPAPRDGDPLPPCWHWMFFRDSTEQSKLGTDGLPERGALMPPVPLPARCVKLAVITDCCRALFSNAAPARNKHDGAKAATATESVSHRR